jgi:hypothetical protein
VTESAGGDGIWPERVECVGYDVGGEGRHRLVQENARTGLLDAPASPYFSELSLPRSRE